MLNSVNLQGTMPHFENGFIYNEGNDDKKSFYSGFISVRKDRKGKDDEYYPEDVFIIKAWGGTADLIQNNIKKGDEFIINGRLEIEDDWTDDDNEEHKGRIYIAVERAYFEKGSKNNKEDGEGKSNSKSNKSSSSSKTSSSSKSNGGSKFGSKSNNSSKSSSGSKAPWKRNG